MPLKTDGYGAVFHDFVFNDVDWSSLQSVYGWAALQYQAWARMWFEIAGSSAQSFAVQTPGVLEYWLDHKHHFGGDFYSFEKAPLIVHLNPGVHTLELRLVRDVRAMGAEAKPGIPIRVRFLPVEPVVFASENSLTVPDIVADRLASLAASVLLTNAGTKTAQNFAVESEDSLMNFELGTDSDFAIEPGQTRPLNFKITSRSPNAETIQLKVRYETARLSTDLDQEDLSSSHWLSIHHALRRRRVDEPHKITFFNTNGVVSYALLRPPPQNLSTEYSVDGGLPVMLVLHGAGVDVNDDLTRTSLDAVKDLPAWTLFPTGGTSWSADDWHIWGWADVEAALGAIPAWISHNKWESSGVCADRWLVAGHSNGGQGVWYALANRPDNVLAAAPISGYSSIQGYVPFQWWRESDPFRQAILQSSLNKFRHELLVPFNAKEIPIMIHHGGADDNVPTFHSRRMQQLLLEMKALSDYVEFPGAGHWFDGILTTNELKEFYKKHLEAWARKPRKSSNFSLRAMSPGNTMGKNGIRIQGVTVPGQIGHVEVEIQNRTITLRSSNVRKLSFNNDYEGYNVCSESGSQRWPIHCSSTESVFEIKIDRHGRIYESNCANSSSAVGASPGGLDTILRSSGRLSIINCCGAEVQKICLQISRNFMQYFGADTEIRKQELIPRAVGNDVLVSVGPHGLGSDQIDFPIQIDGDGVSVTRADGSKMRYSASERAGIGLVHLQPLDHGRLRLVVWGSDHPSLDLAARLIPTLPGAGQPDFVVLSEECRWKGVEGALALGFFDDDWQIAPTSYLT